MLPEISWSASFLNTTQRFAAEPAVSDIVTSITHHGLARRVVALAEAIKAAGVAMGAPVAMVLPNSIDAVVASYAVLIAGCCEVPINVAAGPTEWRTNIELSGARLAICRADVAPTLEQLECRVLSPDQGLASILQPTEPVPANLWARIGFTSGSTGTPKVIVHTQAGRWTGALLQRVALPFRPGPGDRLLAMTPFTHGASLLSHAFLEEGAAVDLLPGVVADEVIPRLRGGTITAMFAPPTVLTKIIALLDGDPVAGLKTIFTGTAPLPPSVYFAARALFGPIVRITYGKTEVFNPITVLDPHETDAYYERGGGTDTLCIGWPQTGVELKIVDETDRPSGVEHAGEICVRAQHMSLGQLRDGTLHPWPHMWHPTGDIGMRDTDGRIHLVGRMADAIKSGGYKLYPAEIEQAISGAMGLPPITVVGLPSYYWGEIVVAVAETSGSDWRETARVACRDLPRYKQPRLFAEMPVLPRNAQHKVMRSEIVASLQRDFSMTDGPYPELHRIEQPPTQE